jgi:hypothetical protein
MMKRFFCKTINCVVACLTFICSLSSSAIGQEAVTGRAFRRVLQQSITGRITNRSLRDTMQQLGSDRGIAIVIDRRIDPNQLLSVRLENLSLADSLAAVADEVNARVSVLDNVVVVGPTKSMKNLATLVQLREKEAKKFRTTRKLRESRTISWPMLTEPKTVVSDIVAGSQIQFKQLDTIPHDLWAAATLPETDGVQALSILLIQFGSTFRFTQSGKSIELVPEPEVSVIEERVRISSKAPENLLKIVAQRFPKAQIKKSGSSLWVQARIETIDAIRDLALGRKPREPPPPAKAAMSDVTYTLTVSQVPARAIFERMKEQGTPIEWDDSALKSAGVDLDKLVAVDVRKADTAEFVKILCDQIGVGFRVETYRVVLFPKP